MAGKTSYCWMGKASQVPWSIPPPADTSPTGLGVPRHTGARGCPFQAVTELAVGDFFSSQILSHIS